MVSALDTMIVFWCSTTNYLPNVIIIQLSILSSTVGTLCLDLKEFVWKNCFVRPNLPDITSSAATATIYLSNFQTRTAIPTVGRYILCCILA